MTNTEPKVTKVSSLGDSAIIDFEDGHQVVLEAYTHGWGYQIEGLRHFFLFNGTEKVVQYDDRLYYGGPRPDEFRFVEVADGYDIERIVSYWQAARTYLHQEFFEKPRAEGRKGADELWLPWKISVEAGMPLHYIKEGYRPLPKKEEVES